MPRPTLTEAQVAVQRRRLTDAALSLYRGCGYEAVTLRRVGAKLRMSHVTPYRYFESKDDLFAAMKAQIFVRFGEHLKQAAGTGGGPVARLRNVCLSAVEFARHHPEDYRLIFSLRQPPIAQYPGLREAWMNTADFVISLFQDAIDAGRLQGDARTWAHTAWSSIHGLLSLHVANLLVLGRDIDDLVDPIIRTLLGDADR
jgi:AcrR family transcriptional regulator